MHLRTIFQPLPSMKFDSFQGGECLGLNKRFYRTLVSKYKAMMVVASNIHFYIFYPKKYTEHRECFCFFFVSRSLLTLVIPLKSKSRIVRFEYIAFQTWNNVENDFVRDPLC